jgi:hypothetical protein
MSVLRFTVPMRPVSVNAAYRSKVVPKRTRSGKTILIPVPHKTDEARIFGEAVAMLGMRARHLVHWQTVTGPVHTLIGVRGDCDIVNVDKVAMDALQKSDAEKHRIGAGIFVDDAQVEFAAFVRLTSGPDRLEIAVGLPGEIASLIAEAQGVETVAPMDDLDPLPTTAGKLTTEPA